MISAAVIKDSVAPSGARLTTFLLTYPRFIHAEVMTHRAFSRNASSSRAIPFEEQVAAIKREIARPLEYRANKRGMQAGEALNESGQAACRYLWRQAALQAIKYASDIHLFGAHKQYATRLLEPFLHITVVLTATEYSNFFALRHHEMAQPELRDLARQMWQLYQSHEPTKRPEGGWHLPFVSEEEYLGAQCRIVGSEEAVAALVRKSVACCARTSYLNHDKTLPTQADNDRLHDRLVGDVPLHASPTEHQAMAVKNASFWSGNFRGFIQYRKTLANENITEFTGPLEGKK